MRSSRIGFGLSLGLLLGAPLVLTLGHCSFHVDERDVCTDLGCKPAGSDGGVVTPPDMATDPNDPTKPGAYKAVPFTVMSPPVGLTDNILLGPSDDGTNISTKENAYPLVLMAPPHSTALAAMRPYAERLATHGFLVGLYQVTDQGNHAAYRDTALQYLNAVLSNTDAIVKSRIDTSHLGAMGYELSAKISVAMALQDSRIGGLYLIDPVDLLSTMGPIDGVATMAQVTLPNGNTTVILGETQSTTGSPPCVQSASTQKGYSAFYDAAKMPAVSITFGGINLGDFISGFPDSVCVTGVTTPQTLAMKYMTAYFQWTLKGQSKQRDYILGNAFQADAVANQLTGINK